MDILVDDEVVGRVLADAPRPGLTAVEPELRNCGFHLGFGNGLSALRRHVIRARRVADGIELPGSPIILEPAASIDPAVEQTVATSVRASVLGAGKPADLDTPLEQVREQIELLLALRQQAEGPGAPLPAHLADLQRRWVALDPAEASPDAGLTASSRRALVVAEAPDLAAFGAGPLLAQIASLTRLGLRVDYVGAEASRDAAAFAAHMAQAGATYRRPPYDLSVEDVLIRDRGLYDVVVLHDIACFERYAGLARHYCPRSRLVFNVGVLRFLAVARRATLQNWQGGLDAARTLRVRETMAVWNADITLTHSVVEAAGLRQSVPSAQVRVVTWPAEPPATPLPFAQRGGVGFRGDFRQFADLDAAMWLIREIMPAVWETAPDVICRIGGTIPPALRALAQDRVAFVERREDVMALAGSVRVAVLPWRAGSGLSGFLAESLAAGTPTIATPVGAEALDLPKALAATVAREPAAIAAEIVRLHSDESAFAPLSTASLDYARTAFSAASLDVVMQGVVGQTAPDSTPADSAPDPAGDPPGPRAG